jgi:hypothetical protein
MLPTQSCRELRHAHQTSSPRTGVQPGVRVFAIASSNSAGAPNSRRLVRLRSASARLPDSAQVREHGRPAPGASRDRTAWVRHRCRTCPARAGAREFRVMVAYISARWNVMLLAPCSSASLRARSSCTGATSIATTSPGWTALASPTVIEPGPQPQSSNRMPRTRDEMKNAASFSAVRRPYRRWCSSAYPCV